MSGINEKENKEYISGIIAVITTHLMFVLFLSNGNRKLSSEKYVYDRW